MKRWKTFVAVVSLALLAACGPREDAADPDVEETAGEEQVYESDQGAGGHEPIATEGADPAEGALPTTGED